MNHLERLLYDHNLISNVCRLMVEGMFPAGLNPQSGMNPRDHNRDRSLPLAYYRALLLWSGIEAGVRWLKEQTVMNAVCSKPSI